MSKIKFIDLADKYHLDYSIILKIATELKIDAKSQKSIVEEKDIKRIEKQVKKIHESIRALTGKSKKIEQEDKEEPKIVKKVVKKKESSKE